MKKRTPGWRTQPWPEGGGDPKKKERLSNTPQKSMKGSVFFPLVERKAPPMPEHWENFFSTKRGKKNPRPKDGRGHKGKRSSHVNKKDVLIPRPLKDTIVNIGGGTSSPTHGFCPEGGRVFVGGKEGKGAFAKTQPKGVGGPKRNKNDPQSDPKWRK